MKSCFMVLTGMEFRFCRMKGVLWVEGGDVPRGANVLNVTERHT